MHRQRGLFLSRYGLCWPCLKKPDFLGGLAFIGFWIGCGILKWGDDWEWGRAPTTKRIVDWFSR